MINDKEKLKQIILEKSYKKGTFKLTSGKVSDFYIDCKQTTLSAEGAYLCGKLLFEMIKTENDISAVGGMTLGADPLVTAVSIVSYLDKAPIPAFIIRKEPKGHGTGSWIEGKGNIPQGRFVAIVEDVVTTGGTLIKAIERTQLEGYNVGIVLTVVDREEGGRELLAQHGFELKAIFTKSELLNK